MKVSSECNEDFVDNDWVSCEGYSSLGCENQVEALVFYGVTNANGVLETSLNCPQCGCGADGAENLNDLLADSDNRKPFDGPPSKE